MNGGLYLASLVGAGQIVLLCVVGRDRGCIVLFV